MNKLLLHQVEDAVLCVSNICVYRSEAVEPGHHLPGRNVITLKCLCAGFEPSSILNLLTFYLAN